MPPCSREVSRSPATRSDDADEPFRLDPSKIRSHMALEGRGRIQDIAPSLVTHKDDPMPQRLPALAMPLHGKKGRRRQRRPGRERRFHSIRSETISFKQASDMSRVRPQAVICRDDPHSLRRPLSRLVADAGQHGHARNTTPRAHELHDGCQRPPSSNGRFQISDFKSQISNLEPQISGNKR